MTDLLKKIRDLCNHPWKRELLFNDRVKWNKLWASMDAIEDTQLAIETYLGLESFDGYNGGYLYIYGLLQALNIQQDAVNNLNKTLFNATIDYKNEYPKLFEIRENRNNSLFLAECPNNKTLLAESHLLALCVAGLDVH
jgi:hypothetical protein